VVNLKFKKPARAIQKFLAVVGDLAVAYSLTSVFRAFDYYDTLFRPVSKLLHVIGGEDLARDFSVPLYYYALYFLIRLYTTMMFGVSIAQFILGLRSKGGKRFVRFAGSVRVLIEFFLSPLLIFDLPALKRNRTMKEMLSFTAIESVESFPKVFIGGGLSLLFFAAAIWSPILEVVKVPVDITLSLDVSKGEHISPKSNFANFSAYSFNIFKLKTFSSLENNRFILIPSFEIVKHSGASVVRPYLKVYDTLSKVEGLVRVDQRFELLKILQLAKSGNPFFGYKYPLLNKFSTNKDYVIDEKVKAEMLSLITSALSLDVGTVLSYITEHGPFIRGGVLLRNAILAVSSLREITRVSIEKIGSNNFLRFIRHLGINSFGVSGGFDAKIVENYIPIDVNEVLVLQLIWEQEESGAKSLNDFKDVFLGNAEWSFDADQKSDLPMSIADLRVTHLVDYMSVKELGENKKMGLFNFYHNYMFDLCKRSFENEDVKLQKILGGQLDRVLEVSSLGVKSTHNDKFVGHIRSLQDALTNYDKGYFKK